MKFCLWNPESWALESRIQLYESGIPLTTEIQNPSSTDKYWNPESKTVLITLHGAKSSINQSMHKRYFHLVIMLTWAYGNQNVTRFLYLFWCYQVTPLDTLLLQRPCSGWWHFLEGQYFTPSKAWCFGQITISLPSSSNKPTRASVSSLSEATYDCFVCNSLKCAFARIQGKNCIDRVIWLIHHTDWYSVRQKSTRTATSFLTKDCFTSTSYTLNWSAQLRNTLKYSCTCIYW